MSTAHNEHHDHDHDHDHGHQHAHGHGTHRSHAAAGGRRGLLLALVITVVMMAAEIVGGILSNSLALLSDAGHMFTDALALALSYFAMKFAEMPATERRTYGFYRLEILAALLNGITLVLISVYILYEAYHRILAPEPVQSTLMMVVAVIGLLVNIAGALFLVKHHETNLNIRGAFLHIIGDAVSSVGVIIGGIIIFYTGWALVDPILSMLIALGIIAGAVGLVVESVNILLESVPSHLNVADITASIGKVAGVREAYHVHVWTITSGVYALSAHLVVDDRPVSSGRALLDEVRRMLTERYGITHSTIQMECERCEDNGTCPLPAPQRDQH